MKTSEVMDLPPGTHDLHGKVSSVHNPPHYTSGSIECIDAIRSALGSEAFTSFCRGSAMKYIWRAGLKGDRKEDLQKAAKYIEFALTK